MAKTMRRPRTERDTTAVLDMLNPSRPAAETNGDIARRAYELYEQRGGEPGRDLDDWLLAENELRGAVRSTAAFLVLEGHHERASAGKVT